LCKPQKSERKRSLQVTFGERKEKYHRCLKTSEGVTISSKEPFRKRLGLGEPKGRFLKNNHKTGEKC